MKIFLVNTKKGIIFAPCLTKKLLVMKQDEIEQAAAARAAQATQDVTDGTNCHTDGTPYTDLERVSEDQMTALLTKAEGVPTRQDGTPYTYQDASPEALDNCNRQLSTCTVWRAVWAGRTSHNGNVMYRLDHCGERYYYYRDLCKLLGAPTQRAEKSELSKARKAQAAAAAKAVADANNAAAAAAAQLAMYTDALTAAAKDGLTAAAVLRSIEQQERAKERANAMDSYRASLPQGLTDAQIELLVNAQYPTPAAVEDVNGEDDYADEEDKDTETALTASTAAAVDNVTAAAAKAAKSGKKVAKKANQ